MEQLIVIPILYLTGLMFGLARVFAIHIEFPSETRRHKLSKGARHAAALYDAFFWPLIVASTLYRENRRRFPKKELDNSQEGVTMDFDDDEIVKAFMELEQGSDTERGAYESGLRSSVEALCRNDRRHATSSQRVADRLGKPSPCAYHEDWRNEMADQKDEKSVTIIRRIKRDAKRVREQSFRTDSVVKSDEGRSHTIFALSKASTISSEDVNAS